MITIVILMTKMSFKYNRDNEDVEDNHSDDDDGRDDDWQSQVSAAPPV